MGDYAINIEASTLMESRHQDGGRARPDVLRLRGARYVTAAEPGEHDELSEPLIRSITGGHAITARPLYGKPIEFKPGAKIFTSTNYKTKIRRCDDGIWRRIRLFPFTVTIPKEKRKRDYGDLLYDREGPGIFNWMLGEHKFGGFIATLFSEERDRLGNRYWAGIRWKTAGEIENDALSNEKWQDPGDLPG